MIEGKAGRTDNARLWDCVERLAAEVLVLRLQYEAEQHEGEHYYSVVRFSQILLSLGGGRCVSGSIPLFSRPFLSCR